MGEGNPLQVRDPVNITYKNTETGKTVTQPDWMAEGQPGGPRTPTPNFLTNPGAASAANPAPVNGQPVASSGGPILPGTIGDILSKGNLGRNPKQTTAADLITSATAATNNRNAEAVRREAYLSQGSDTRRGTLLTGILGLTDNSSLQNGRKSLLGL
jgi:hypothetical protein